MKENFSCPLWTNSLSLEGGLKRRICCHDHTAEIENLGEDLDHFEISKRIRETASNGTIPENCMGCYKLEQSTGDSPRLFYKEFFKNNTDDGLYYVDITFENFCNLSCFTCKPIYSDKIEREFNTLNIPYERNGLGANNFNLQFESTKAQILDSLQNNSLIVISGGEPALSKNVLNFIKELSNLNIAKTATLRIFSNLTISAKWIYPYIKKFKRVEFIISIDAIESRAEYIRYPSKWSKIDNNFKELVKETQGYYNFEINVHSVLSILNFDHLPKLINYFATSNLKLIPNFTLLDSPKIYKIENLSKKKIEQVRENLFNFISSLDETFFDNPSLTELKNIVKNINPESEDHLLDLFLHHKKLDQSRNKYLLEEITYLK
ncbi:twitch domain-containing radical SAM protein [Halobacteriovorax marinus]|uniref:twitch domain-containing radical SAM protein n=1 Tax=Halobacteriovorax marinus TaxID=97084 RepID=UPI003A955D83